ncbi:MAG: 3-oxoacyl-[acyl-carrier-protein] reductase [Nitrospinota bacterium]
MDNPERRVALVTGAAKGIGRAIAVRLAQENVDLVLTVNRSDIEETVEEAERAGSKVFVLKGDVKEYKTAETCIEQCISQFGKIDILVNNAGITKDNILPRMKQEEWDSVLRVNLDGVFNFTKAAAKYMIKQRGGRIINITSVIGETGNPGQANYAASKAGIIGFTKSIAQELGSRGVTVNAVAPGYIVTDMTESVTEKSREKLISLIPLKRLGNPEDVSECVAFLASGKAAYITGQVIHVNGGMYM